MNRLRCMLLAAAGVVLLPLAAASASAAVVAPSADALAHCAAIAAADARLACYDALAGHAASTAAVPAPVPAPAPTAENDPHNFGIAQVRVNEPPKGPAAIQAHVAQVFDNGITRASVVLDNGQTWTFTESSADASLSPGDPVTIKRAVLGSFMLVTPSKHSYHVHRVQ